MRKLYALAGAALLLGCMDDGSKATAPQLSGAVVGVSADRGGNGNGQGHDDHGNGQKLAVTLLTGEEEVPPRPTHGSGELILRLNPDGHSVDYSLEMTNIANVTQAHIHMAPPGVNGGIVVWLFPNAKSTAALPGGGGLLRRLAIEGTFTEADFRGALAGQPLSALINAIVAGNTYGNIHTDDGVAPPNTGPGDFPGGEIRGQLDVHAQGHDNGHGHDH